MGRAVRDSFGCEVRATIAELRRIGTAQSPLRMSVDLFPGVTVDLAQGNSRDQETTSYPWPIGGDNARNSSLPEATGAHVHDLA